MRQNVENLKPSCLSGGVCRLTSETRMAGGYVLIFCNAQCMCFVFNLNVSYLKCFLGKRLMEVKLS